LFIELISHVFHTPLKPGSGVQDIFLITGHLKLLFKVF